MTHPFLTMLDLLPPIVKPDESERFGHNMVFEFKKTSHLSPQTRQCMFIQRMSAAPKSTLVSFSATREIARTYVRLHE